MEKLKKKPRGKSGRRYSNTQKALMIAEFESLEEMGTSKKQASIIVSNRNGMTPRNILKLIADKHEFILTPGESTHLKKALTSKSYAVSMLAQENVTQDKLDKASFVQLMVGSKIALEMGRLLEDRSTSNVSHRGFIETMQADRQKIVDQLRTYGLELDEENAS